MAEWPRPFHPVIDGEVDLGVTVEVYQHLPGQTAEFVADTDGDELFLNGGPVVLLPGTRKAADRLVGLGDYAAKTGSSWRAEPADGFFARYLRAE